MSVRFYVRELGVPLLLAWGFFLLGIDPLVPWWLRPLGLIAGSAIVATLALSQYDQVLEARRTRRHEAE